MVAHFDLETQYFAVNKDKTKYSLLDNDGILYAQYRQG
jgi:hypothetical protein